MGRRDAVQRAQPAGQSNGTYGQGRAVAQSGGLGHWRSECVEFHDRLVNAYRPSMRDKIDMASLWRRARRKVTASFADHGEPQPVLPAACPFTLDELIDPDLDVERLVAMLKNR